MDGLLGLKKSFFKELHIESPILREDLTLQSLHLYLQLPLILIAGNGPIFLSMLLFWFEQFDTDSLAQGEEIFVKEQLFELFIDGWEGLHKQHLENGGVMRKVVHLQEVIHCALNARIYFPGVCCDAHYDIFKQPLIGFQIVASKCRHFMG